MSMGHSIKFSSSRMSVDGRCTYIQGRCGGRPNAISANSACQEEMRSSAETVARPTARGVPIRRTMPLEYALIRSRRARLTNHTLKKIRRKSGTFGTVKEGFQTYATCSGEISATKVCQILSWWTKN